MRLAGVVQKKLKEYKEERVPPGGGGAGHRGGKRQLTWMPVHFEFGIRELVMNNAKRWPSVRRPAREIESAPVKRQVPGERA